MLLGSANLGAASVYAKISTKYILARQKSNITQSLPEYPAQGNPFHGRPRETLNQRGHIRVIYKAQPLASDWSVCNNADQWGDGCCFGSTSQRIDTPSTDDVSKGRSVSPRSSYGFVWYGLYNEISRGRSENIYLYSATAFPAELELGRRESALLSGIP